MAQPLPPDVQADALPELTHDAEHGTRSEPASRAFPRLGSEITARTDRRGGRDTAAARRPLARATVESCPMKTIFCAVACLLATSSSAQTVPACTATTNMHQRWSMKTRPTPAGFSDSDATPLTIAQIVQWAVPKGKILTDSVINPHESEVVSVTGYVRLVTLAGDDCDLHIQMSPGPTKHVPQIIAEIPPGQTATRSALAQLLGVSIHAAGGKAIFFDGARAVKVTVEGMAFDDASHWSKANPKTARNVDEPHAKRRRFTQWF